MSDPAGPSDPTVPLDETQPPVDGDKQRFGPSPWMVVGGFFTHPLTWMAAITALFGYSSAFRVLLWSFALKPWHEFLMHAWAGWLNHAYLPWVLAATAISHLVLRYLTSGYALDGSFLYVQSGLLSWGSPGGPLRVYNNPVAFTTIIDADAQRGPLGLITGTGTIFVKSSESPGKDIKLTWVPHVKSAHAAILTRAGVRNARILSSIRSG